MLDAELPPDPDGGGDGGGGGDDRGTDPSSSEDGTEAAGSSNGDAGAGGGGPPSGGAVAVGSGGGGGGSLVRHKSIVRMNLTGGFESLPRLDRRTSSSSSLGGGKGGGTNGGGRGGPSSTGGTTVGGGLATSSVTVNFIDPTTTTASTATSSSSASAKWSRGASSSSRSYSTRPSQELYRKLVEIFVRDYDSTLNSVPYRNVRSGAPGTIPSLPVRCLLTGGGSGNSDGSADAPGPGTTDAPWGGAAAVTTPVSDPAEWHTGPYCHVYIAACDNLDHYRAKVRPALQAFVSQIEGAAGGAGERPNGEAPRSGETGTSAKRREDRREKTVNREREEARDAARNLTDGPSRGNYSSQYLIVYVPTGGTGGIAGAIGGALLSEMGGGSGGGGMGGGSRKGGLASRIGAARRTMQQNAAAAAAAQSSQDVTKTEATGEERSVSSGSGMSNVPEETEADISAAPPPGPISHSSKAEKELFRKFTVDFPHGRTCIMSTLLDSASGGKDGKGSGDTDAAATAAICSPLKNQEWNAFLRSLGSAIVSGFRDRCRRYDEELRRLDKRRAGVLASARSGAGQSSAAASRAAFDLSHFFLVKESLAFTYEQMRLPAEALLQYEELEAFVPESTWRGDDDGTDGEGPTEQERRDDYDGLVGKRSTRNLVSPPSSSASNRGNAAAASARALTASVPVAELAAAGDTIGFRRRVRATTDMSSISHLILQYLYARESALLFQLGLPVEIVRRSQSFAETLYNMRMLGIKADRKARKERKSTSLVDHRAAATRKRAEAEAWALNVCWDVKAAADAYFDYRSRDGVPAPRKPSDPPVSDHRLEAMAEVERDAARELSELLEFARLRLVKLGDLELGCDNPIRAAAAERPPDTLEPWTPWSELDHHRTRREGSSGGAVGSASPPPPPSAMTTKGDDAERPESLSNVYVDGSSNHASSADVTYSRTGIGQKYFSSFLRGAFVSREAFERKFLELSGSIVSMHECAGRYRFAARMQGERAEVLMLRGEHEEAAKVLRSIVYGRSSDDRWDRARYWRLFRLCCCQRLVGDAPAYLDTLTRCFAPRFRDVAPTKTADLLQRDLEAVVGEPDVSSVRLGVSPFLETELQVVPTATGKSSHPLGYLRKKVVKHFCAVGETLIVNLFVTSHLPRPIVADDVRLFLVTFDHYESVHRGGRPLDEGDAVRILSIDDDDEGDANGGGGGGPVEIRPGRNAYNFTWVPMTVGQYVLSTVNVRWKEASIFHDSALLRRPILGVDVLPSEPTQTIELNPLFLIPGHVQQVRLVFQSGSDLVTSGRVELTCSEGLRVIPPGTDPRDYGDDAWLDSCEVPLEGCGPGTKLTLTTSVKSDSGVSETDGENGGGGDARLREYQQGQRPDRGRPTVQTMRAKVTTSYRHSLYDDVSRPPDEPESPPMTTVLEAMVTTLDRPAFSVDSADAFGFRGDEVMVGVGLHCNTPVPFFLKKWDLQLPPPLVVSSDGDMNRGLFGHAVAEGEQLFFGFKCIHAKGLVGGGDDGPDDDEPPILHVVLQDEFGKTFRQVLHLDLGHFYDQLKRENEFATANHVTAELTCDVDEGVVGGPVRFTYSVDSKALEGWRTAVDGHDGEWGGAPPSLLYAISSDETDWILGGKVHGTLDRWSAVGGGDPPLRLDFVGIPTRSGVLKRFPKIALRYLSLRPSTAGGGKAGASSSPSAPPITVNVRHPDSFKSLSYTNHMALACPAAIDI